MLKKPQQSRKPQFDVKNSSGEVQTWTLDVKTPNAGIIVGAGSTKPDIIIAVADADFIDLGILALLYYSKSYY